MSDRIVYEHGHIYEPQKEFVTLIEAIERFRPQHMNDIESNCLIEELEKLNKKITVSDINKKIESKFPDVKVKDVNNSVEDYTYFQIIRNDETLHIDIYDDSFDIQINKKNKTLLYSSHPDKSIKNSYHLDELPDYAKEILQFLCELSGIKI